MRLLELHFEDGSPVLVFLHSIVTIHRGDDELTKINLSDGCIWVKETPNEIKLKIYG
jgi:hypothetical protein